jgi:hypothetical protein
MRFLILATVFSFFQFAIAVLVQAAPQEHHVHQRMGSHGMVLFTDGQDLYASHLPLYRAPHDYQIVYEVTSSLKAEIVTFLNEKESATLNDGRAKMTLLPMPFDLNRLVKGETFAINATVFKGHFEREGEAWKENTEFHFVKQVYKRQIAFPVASTKKKSPSRAKAESNWERFALSDNDKALYIYRIQSRPSFDAIVLAEKCPALPRLPSIASRTPSVKQLGSAFEQCYESRTIYFETADFAL